MILPAPRYALLWCPLFGILSLVSTYEYPLPRVIMIVVIREIISIQVRTLSQVDRAGNVIPAVVPTSLFLVPIPSPSAPFHQSPRYPQALLGIMKHSYVSSNSPRHLPLSVPPQCPPLSMLPSFLLAQYAPPTEGWGPGSLSCGDLVCDLTTVYSPTIF